MKYSELGVLIQQVREAHREPVVLFDLDGTLYDNTWRTLRILQEFAVRNHARFPRAYDAVVKLSPHALAYRVDDTLAKAGLTDPELVAAAHAFWKERFFTNAYQSFDMALPGAVELVNRLRNDGATVVYFTGRDAANMLLGTVSALQRDGFPVGTADTHVVMKPDFDLDDTTYKMGALTQIRRLGEVVAAFDNEPTLANCFQEAFPDAAVFHLNTSWAPTPAPVELRKNIHVINDFRPFLSD